VGAITLKVLVIEFRRRGAQRELRRRNEKKTQTPHGSHSRWCDSLANETKIKTRRECTSTAGFWNLKTMEREILKKCKTADFECNYLLGEVRVGRFCDNSQFNSETILSQESRQNR
jgi:hypothetical protein